MQLTHLCSVLCLVLKDFFQPILKLKVHLLEHLLGAPENEHEYSDNDWATIIFQQNRIYHHKVVWFNYITYDMHQNQDSCNPHTHANVMTLSGDENLEVHVEHLYWYAWIIGAFHANVIHSGSSSTLFVPWKMDFLFVQWFAPAPEQCQYGIHAKRMPKLGFIDANDPESFGFLDPSSVICDGDMDYFHYYVNMYVIVLSLVLYSNMFSYIGGQTEICSCAFVVGE